MVSKKTLKYIKSLQLKKYRKAENAFIVEGAKSVLELFNSDFKVKTVLATPLFLKQQKHFLLTKQIEIMEVSEQELQSAGTYKTNNAAIAIAAMRENISEDITGTFSLALDRINDPGNLGTILRIADWYGVKHIVCSADCADFYNPKVIAASMGSFTRVHPFYTDLEDYLKGTSLPIFGASLEGEDVHQCDFGKEGIILMGSESQGIHPNIMPLVKKRINIPSYGKAESLNVAIATAIICDNLKRTGV